MQSQDLHCFLVVFGLMGAAILLAITAWIHSLFPKRRPKRDRLPVTQARMERVHVRVSSPHIFYSDMHGKWGGKFAEGPAGEVICRKCRGKVSALSGDDQRFTPDMNLRHDNLIGLFCLMCETGVHVTDRAQTEARPVCLDYLLAGYEKRAAFYQLIPQETNQQPLASKAFFATLEGAGTFRDMPLRIRVDPETKTFRPVEDEPLAEAEFVEHQDSEPAKKTLSN